MPNKYHLAQVNIATALSPLDTPLMQGFMDQLDRINRLAEASSGFVWRMQTEEGDATAIQLFDNPLTIVNMSLWDSFEALKSYVYSGEHLAVLKDKKQWFEKAQGPMLALWWIPAGEVPTLCAAKAALATLAENGATPMAFTFAKPFPAPDRYLLPQH